MELTAWVAVGAFAMISHGNAGITVAATDELYKTEKDCKEQLARVEKSVENRPTNIGVELVAYGTNCVEVKIKQVEPKPNV
jgi:hypothetical protein